MYCREGRSERTIVSDARPRGLGIPSRAALHARRVLHTRAAARRGALRADRGGALHGAATDRSPPPGSVASGGCLCHLRGSPSRAVRALRPPDAHLDPGEHVPGARPVPRRHRASQPSLKWRTALPPRKLATVSAATPCRASISRASSTVPVSWFG